jgi:hypothetical protein
MNMGLLPGWPKLHHQFQEVLLSPNCNSSDDLPKLNTTAMEAAMVEAKEGHVPTAF